jgi:hypothetical protein
MPGFFRAAGSGQATASERCVGTTEPVDVVQYYHRSYIKYSINKTVKKPFFGSTKFPNFLPKYYDELLSKGFYLSKAVITLEDRKISDTNLLIN